MIGIKDVWGRMAYEKYVKDDPTPSANFKKALHMLWHKHEGMHGLRASGWDYIKESVLPLIDPNNRRMAYELCNSIRMLTPPLSNERTSGETGYYTGLAGQAFKELAEAYKGTALGEFCDFASHVEGKVTRRDQALLFDMHAE